MTDMNGMNEATQKAREELGITETDRCYLCCNCGLCIKSHLYMRDNKPMTLAL